MNSVYNAFTAAGISPQIINRLSEIQTLAYAINLTERQRVTLCLYAINIELVVIIHTPPVSIGGEWRVHHGWNVLLPETSSPASRHVLCLEQLTEIAETLRHLLADLPAPESATPETAQ